MTRCTRGSRSEAGSFFPFKDGDLVDVAFGLEAGITPPPVRMDHAAGGNGIQDERVQTFGRSIRNQAKADSPDAPAILLSCHDNQRFGLYQAAP